MVGAGTVWLNVQAAAGERVVHWDRLSAPVIQHVQVRRRSRRKWSGTSIRYIRNAGNGPV